MQLISKEKAIELNQKWYFTGEKCKNNHIDKRYVNTGICYECKRQINKNCNLRNKETLIKNSKKYYINNKEKKLKISKDWAQNNRVKSNLIKKNYKIKHKEKYLLYCSNYQKNKRKNPHIRLSKNLSKSIWECLKGNKNTKTWKLFVSFTLEQLIIHLENKFTDNMNWENYGSYWHLDHIIPISWFDLEKDFNKAWDLSNLQPLKKEVNLSKGNRYAG